MAYPTYKVTVTRDSNVWVAIVTDGLPEGVVGGLDFEHFTDIDDGMRELIADLTDAQPHEFWIEWHYDFGSVTDDDIVNEYLRAHEVAAEVNEWVENARVNLIAHLSGRVSQRAIAEVVELSHQRVNQLAGKGPVTTPLPDPSDFAQAMNAAIRRLQNLDRANLSRGIEELNQQYMDSGRALARHLAKYRPPAREADSPQQQLERDDALRGS